MPFMHALAAKLSVTVEVCALHKAKIAEGPVEGLMVGWNPTDAAVVARRAIYSKSARYLAGALARKAARATSLTQARALARAVRPHCSATAEWLERTANAHFGRATR